MKILYVANLASAFLRKFSIPEILELRKKGWTVDVAANMDVAIPEADHCYSMPWWRSPFSPNVIKGIHQLRKVIKEGHYDIVYSMTPVGGLAARQAVNYHAKNRPATVYFAHGFHFYHGASPVAWLTIYPVEWLLSFKTDVLLTTNDEDFAFAKKHMHAHRICFSNELGVNTKKFTDVVLTVEDKAVYAKEFGIEGHSPILFYAAELSKTKNQIFLLKVITKLKERGYNPLLLLAGIDTTDGGFKKTVEQEGLSDNVRLLGFRKDCPKIYHMVDFAVASSLREGLGLNMVEGMASSIPVLAVDNRGSRQVIKSGENGYLYSKTDYVGMANGIVELMNDKKKHDDFVAKGLERAKAFDFETVFPALYDIYATSIDYKKKKK
jgi:glycosyltransferase EpsD